MVKNAIEVKKNKKSQRSTASTVYSTVYITNIYNMFIQVPYHDLLRGNRKASAHDGEGKLKDHFGDRES